MRTAPHGRLHQRHGPPADSAGVAVSPAYNVNALSLRCIPSQCYSNEIEDIWRSLHFRVLSKTMSEDEEDDAKESDYTLKAVGDCEI